MRLLHTSTLELHEFYGEVIPDYAILSHTWGEGEVSFQELNRVKSIVSREQNELKGYRKITDCCKLAASDGWQYVWIDTCCIDKTSSTELSEAINSMYRWYGEAQICYAYLADVDSAGQNDPLTMRRLERSRWFTRGWTLQELLAPDVVVFYDNAWVEIGTRSSLSYRISKITGIKHDHLIRPFKASVAAKMSWASNRTTTRIEDIAYSLMGLFEVNMPLLYGEGSKAFTRLQHEIVKISDDESIFAWEDSSLLESGAFARSPGAFRQSGNLVSVKFPHLERPPYTVTHRGLAIELTLEENPTMDTDDMNIFTAALQCALVTDLAVPVSIQLMSINQRDMIRISPRTLIYDYVKSQKDRNAHNNKLVYIRPIDEYDFTVGTNQAPTFYVRIPSQSASEFSISETYQCQPELSSRNEAQRKECWKVEIDLQDDLAALLLKKDQDDRQEAFAIMLIASKRNLQMDVIIPIGSETLTELVENKFSQLDQYADRCEKYLPYGLRIVASLRRRDAGCFVDIEFLEESNSHSSDVLCDTASPEISRSHSKLSYTRNSQSKFISPWML